MSRTAGTAHIVTEWLNQRPQAEFKWPRPAAMEGVNLFRLEDLDERGAPFVVPPGSELDAGLQRMLNQADGDFKRCDLPGPQQETNWSTEVCGPFYIFGTWGDQLTASTHSRLGQPIIYSTGRRTIRMVIWPAGRPARPSSQLKVSTRPRCTQNWQCGSFYGRRQQTLSTGRNGSPSVSTEFIGTALPNRANSTASCSRRTKGAEERRLAEARRGPQSAHLLRQGHAD